MLTIPQLLVRRRVLTPTARRHRPRPVPAPQPPRALVVAYTRTLLSLSHAMDDAIVQALTAERVIRMDDLGPPLPPTPSVVARVLGTIATRLHRMANGVGLAAAIEHLGARVAAHADAQWARQLRAAFGIDTPPHPMDLTRQIADFRAANVALIQSLAQDKRDRVAAVLAQHTPDMPLDQLATKIREQTGVTDSRAALIATDQVYRLNAQITRTRHQAAGVTHYTWRTSGDAHVRPGHRALNGTRQRYTQPPLVDERSGRRAGPGEDIRCRCQAAPDLQSAFVHVAAGRLLGLAA